MFSNVLLAIVGVGCAALNLAYWYVVVTRGERRFRAWVERHYRVSIGHGHRGHWRVSGEGSKLRLLGIELLQLAYFMGAFVVWSLSMLFIVLLFKLADSFL